MVAGCGMTCIKYIVFVVNFLFFVLGIAAVALGIYALVDKNDMNALTKIDSDGKLEDFNAVGLLQSGAIVLIVGGSFLVILGFLGCCGAVKEVKCLLATYAGLVILILIIEIAAAAVAIAFRGRVEDELKGSMIKGVQKYYNGNVSTGDAFSRAFDFAQVYFECCGVNSTNDFKDSPWDKETKAAGEVVPMSCCALKDKDKFLDDNKLEKSNLVNQNCQTTATGAGNPNTNKPCYDSIKDWIEDRAAIIIGIAFGIVVIQLIAVVFAICLYRAIESD